MDEHTSVTLTAEGRPPAAHPEGGGTDPVAPPLDGSTGTDLALDAGTDTLGDVGEDAARRRFTVAVLIGAVAASVAYLWTLWELWQPLNPLRKTHFEDNFYDLQARAMLHGHLFIPTNSIGIEAFVHDGHQYTYFGLFPSLIRLPVLVFTDSLDAKLTPSSMLLAWLATALFVSLLSWRVRVLVRGPVAMGWGEAASWGLFVATVLGGSVILYLAESPYVFSEDLAWSVALTTGAVFALLGLSERPSWPRVVGAGGLILAANLDRLTTGWACVIGAVLLAAWFRTGRGGDAGRRWFWPALLVGLVPVAAGCAVNLVKFGVLFGLPVTDQVWSHVNLHREHFLAVNHNSEVGLAFLPSNALAYLRPNGLRLTGTFPFITLPAAPARALLGTVFDRTYRTASMPASMPFLFVAGAWGTIASFRPRRPRRPRPASTGGSTMPGGWAGPVRIMLLATACAGGALLLWGYIANRYLADFVPFLVVASAVGLVDLWRRADGRGTRARRYLAAGVVVLAAFEIVANIGIAITPTNEFSQPQTLRYVEAQHTVSGWLGTSMAGHLRSTKALPAWAPADQLAVVRACAGLYISTGEDYSTVPLQQYQRATWLPVELGPTFDRRFTLTFHQPASGPRRPQTIPLVDMKGTTLSADIAPYGPGRYRLGFSIYDEHFHPQTWFTVEKTGQPVSVETITDTAQHLVRGSVNGQIEFQSAISSSSAPKAAGVSTDQLSVTPLATPASATSLCQSLVRGS